MITINGHVLPVTRFPDGTSQVWNLPQKLLEPYSTPKIIWDFDSEDEFLHLAQLKYLLDRRAIKPKLRLNFLPYGRQDKEGLNDETFALRPFAQLLNTLKFSEIECLDPHSNTAKWLIDNLVVLLPTEEVQRVNGLLNSDVFCYPDEGAFTRYAKLFERPCIYGTKERDQKTGRITSYTLHGSPKDQSVLIVDDICDGGATFEILTDQLLSAGAKEVNLFVTHGIFSRGLKPLRKAGINRIFTHKGESVLSNDPLNPISQKPFEGVNNESVSNATM